MKDFFENPNMQFISKGRIGFGVDENLQVEDDGKGYIWLAAEMCPGGLALETFLDKRIDTTWGGPQVKQR